MSLKPIKRLEMILDGQDIEPVTRLEYFLKKAAEGGGSSSGGLVEIKNVEPFQVPDLVNGGTRLFDPVNDSLYFVPDEGGIYTEINKFFVSNETPPGILYDTGEMGLTGYITISWFEVQAYEKLDAKREPEFCVAPSSFYVVLTDDFNGFIVKPENIVYNYILNKDNTVDTMTFNQLRTKERE